ncbi:hypothetical protein Q5752_000052 [Cryptotrichosporon argae]
MSLLRVSAARALPLARSFSVSAARKDLIQDLYVSQLKSYKAPAQAKDAHVAHVKQYSAPAPPSAPQLPSDLAAALASFDATEPSLGAPAAKSAAAPKTDESGEGADEYLAFLEKDLPKVDKHH